MSTRDGFDLAALRDHARRAQARGDEITALVMSEAADEIEVLFPAELVLARARVGLPTRPTGSPNRARFVAVSVNGGDALLYVPAENAGEPDGHPTRIKLRWEAV